MLSRLRFTWQILILQVAVVVLLLATGFALVWWLLRGQLTESYGQRALGIAAAVAADPQVIAQTARREPGGPMQAHVLAVRSATRTLFVVVTDDRGIRLAHPDPSRIGTMVSTDPSRALAGHDVVSVVERGSLGLSVRSKVPVREGGRVLGEVSVGFDVAVPASDLRRLLGSTAAFGAAALGLGVGASALLVRRLRRQTLGLQPHELTELLHDREAVLHGIGEGVLAVDEAGRVAVCNDEARRLLGVTAPAGTPVSELELPARLRAALAGGNTGHTGGDTDNLITVVGQRVLVVNARVVRRGEHTMGTVLTLRDRTDYEQLTNELDAVRALSAGLRAQRHEFSNRLHTLSGLLQLGHHAEAEEYLQALTDTPAASDGALADALSDVYLRAFLAAKFTQAGEKGVTLRLAADSWVPAAVREPVTVTTVLGNLVDNAIEAARLGTRRPAEVEVALLAEGGTLHMSVADSGAGVPAALRGSLFTEGVSTKDETGHGLGLALARQAAQSGGGAVWLADGGGAESGALFVARLPGGLEERG